MTIRRFLKPLAKVRHAFRAFRLLRRSRKENFTEIYEKNAWRDAESRSGTGSNLQATEEIRAALPKLIREFQIKSLLDIPCGDMHWMSRVDLDIDLYTGADIVSDLVEKNRAEHASPKRQFVCLDLVSDNLPQHDLVFCRDCLVHLSFADARAAIENVKNSGSRYLMTTTNPGRESNRNIVTGMWRPLNLQKPPFSFPEPLRIINERCEEANGAHRDKSMGLWRIADL